MHRGGVRALASSSASRKDRQIRMEADALDPANAEHCQRGVVLQAAELVLDGGAVTVEPLPGSVRAYSA